MKTQRIVLSIIALILILLPAGCKGFGFSVKAIEITSGSDKIYYKEGELFDSKGMVVKMIYENGLKKKIKNYTLSKEAEEPLSSGVSRIGVSYTDKSGNEHTAFQKINVIQDGVIHYTTAKGTEIAPVYDIAPKISGAYYTRERVRLELLTLKNMGFSRIYFVLCNPGQPMFSTQRIAPSLNSRYYLMQSHESLENDPNRVYAEVCLQLGMEPFAIIKPYESGGGMSVPAGVTIAEGGYHDATVGGNRVYFDTFLDANPDMRVIRKPDYDEDDYKLPITKIEVEFMLDTYTNPSASSPTSYKAISGDKINYAVPRVWVSRDNATYTLYEGDFDYNYTLEKRTIYDANGENLLGGERNCQVLAITGLNIGEEYQYAALTFDDKTNLRTIPYSMIKMFSGEKELKLTGGVYVRVISDSAAPGEWGAQELPQIASQLKTIEVREDGTVKGTTSVSYIPSANLFYKNGFEFNWYGTGHQGDGWVNSHILGIARGKAQTLPGTLCEAYPEVREYWLSQVKDSLDAGFKGVDIRLQSHSSMICDIVNYGYNQPIVDKYKELYGVDILTQEADFVRIMQIRGDFFMMFLEEASALVHERGALFQIHLKGAHEEPRVDYIWNTLGHWTMPKIALDWRRCVELADEITIKDYHWKDYKPSLGGQIKDYAASLGKRVWIHCYVQQGDEFDRGFISDVEKDGRITGILLYEVVYFDDFLSKANELLTELEYKQR